MFCPWLQEYFETFWKFLLSSPLKNQLNISPLNSIPGAKLDCHRGTWTGLVKARRSSSACVFLARQDLDVTPWQLKPLHLPDYCYYFYHHYYRKLINVKQGPMEMFQINSEQKPFFFEACYALQANIHWN